MNATSVPDTTSLASTHAPALSFAWDCACSVNLVAFAKRDFLEDVITLDPPERIHLTSTSHLLVTQRGRLNGYLSNGAPFDAAAYTGPEVDKNLLSLIEFARQEWQFTFVTNNLSISTPDGKRFTEVYTKNNLTRTCVCI